MPLLKFQPLYIFLKIEDYEGVWFTCRQICNLHTVIFIINGRGPLCATSIDFYISIIFHYNQDIHTLSYLDIVNFISFIFPKQCTLHKRSNTEQMKISLCMFINQGPLCGHTVGYVCRKCWSNYVGVIHCIVFTDINTSMADIPWWYWNQSVIIKVYTL